MSTTRTHHSPGPSHQCGAALLTAMIIVTLVVTLASSMVWQQWRAVQVEVVERARAQSAWILTGALDWARLILREDARAGGVDHLGEPWAVPLAEARLSTFLAADKSNADDGPDAFLSGSITDAQARFNVTNLVNEGKVDPLEQAALERLCQSVGVASSVARLIANGMRDALAPPDTTSAAGAGTATGTPTGPLLPRSVSQLSWLGVDPKSLSTLQPYLAVLPTVTPINVNTASSQVLAAEIVGLDLGSAERLLQLRQRTPFKNLGDFVAQVRALEPIAAKISVSSNFFEVRGRLRLTDRVLEERSLVQRLPDGQVRLIERERVSSRDEKPAS